MVLGGSQPSPGPLHLRKPSWAPAPGGKATCSRAGVPNCRFSLGRGWRRAGAIPPRTERPLSPPPAALSLSHNPLRRQQPPPPSRRRAPALIHRSADRLRPPRRLLLGRPGRSCRRFLPARRRPVAAGRGAPPAPHPSPWRVTR